MIFIGYKNNGYYFMHHTQENIIFYFTYAIFDKELFPKCTNSYMKEYKLYDKLLNKLSPEIEPSVPDTSGKDRPAPVSISHILIPFIQKNPPIYSPSPPLSYRSLSPLLTLGSKKPTVKIEKDNDVNFDIGM